MKFNFRTTCQLGALLAYSGIGQAQVTLEKINTLSTGLGEGSAEIISYDPGSQQLFVINSGFASFSIFDFTDPTQASTGTGIDLSSFGAGPNSIASHNGVVAVAVEANTVTDAGTVEFFDTSGNHLRSLTVGALPDMLTFTPDGNQLLVANEGEPDGGINPLGSVSLIDLSSGVAAATVNTLDFTAFNVGQPRHGELPSAVIIAPGQAVAEDLEPEYIAISEDGSQAFVTLQENNAVAVLDLTTPAISSILALGFKDHSLVGNELDPSDRDGPGGTGAININNWPVKGIYMPDAIAAVNVGGSDYYLTANEGDARDEDDRIGNLLLDPTAFPNAATLQLDEQLGRLDAQTNLGGSPSGFTELFVYGGRSFSIWDGSTGAQVFDSGSEIAFKIAELTPELFNANNSSPSDFDERSDNKGAEPEGITTAQVGQKHIAFIGLERVGGVMVYDISEPALAEFESYHPASDGDVAPEGLLFIAGANNGSGTDLLLVSYEDTGTIGVFRVLDVIFKNNFE
ncbi:choice-of-anchor I family protein [Marinicella meishanensis]|uniref:choice-of-anchor I family protein n=1 Tax=Marinicella meishanensis TaxID=2873263 RepID=UPI001CBB8337|nr:choice-of-anchor I family protein [Marinicella sp. NBU2979]